MDAVWDVGINLCSGESTVDSGCGFCRVSSKESILVENNDVSSVEVDGVRSTETGHYEGGSLVMILEMMGYESSSGLRDQGNLHPPPTTITLGVMMISFLLFALECKSVMGVALVQKRASFGDSLAGD